MSWPYIHLLLNHFPLILLMLGTLAGIGAVVTQRRTLWLYAVANITLAGGTIYPVVLTGHKAEHVVEEMPGVLHDNIEEHEEGAEWALWLTLIAGAISAVSWWMLAFRGGGRNVNTENVESIGGSGRLAVLPNWLGLAVVLSAMLALASVIVTALHGGKIFHEGI